jgi:hypothetical protein
LQARVVIGLRKVNPVDLGTGISLSSTPANSPSATFSLVAARHSSPTFCQSASVGLPLPTPGIARICARTESCAMAGPAPMTVGSIAIVPKAAVPRSMLRRLILAREMAS